MAKPEIPDAVLFPPVRIPRDVAARVDSICEDNHLSRSWIVRRALIDYVSARRPAEVR